MMMKRKNLKMSFISATVLDSKNKRDRIEFILNKVKDGTILITDGVLIPEEEMDLIRETMRRVDTGFPGIEVCSLKKQTTGITFLAEKLSDQSEKIKQSLSKIVGTKDIKTAVKSGLTLIGPAKFIKRIKKNPESFSVFAEV